MDDSFPAEFPAFVLQTVLDGAPVLQVVHFDDGSWGFTDGVTEPTEQNLVLVCLDHLLETDPTLRPLAALQPGWQADRDGVGEPWIHSRHQEPHRTGLVDRFWYVVDAIRFGDEVAMQRLYERYQVK
jgi:hypothetical protein